MSEADSASASQALISYGLGNATVEPLGSGLINETFLVSSDAERFVLQRLNPVFNPKINCDIDKLTRHLESAGAITQRVVPISEEPRRLWLEQDGYIWRLCTYVPGVCFDRLENTGQAMQAGALLGRFHRLISDLSLNLHGDRLGVHDTARHMQNLQNALAEHRDHRYYDSIAVLGERVLEAAARLPALPELPDRMVHGDPKISNLVFEENSGAGICMIDLDTLAYMPLPLEIGDAVRSWCNPKGEDERQAQFRMDFFAAAMSGYADKTRELLQPQEWQSFVPAARTIMVELAARMCTDALRESYFGWNDKVFPDRSTHNQVRAEGQLNLHQSFCEHVEQAGQIVASAFDT